MLVSIKSLREVIYLGAVEQLRLQLILPKIMFLLVYQQVRYFSDVFLCNREMLWPYGILQTSGLFEFFLAV